MEGRMKLKAGEVFNAAETIKLLDERRVKFPFQGRIGLAQIKAHLSVTCDETVRARNELITKYGVEKNGQPVLETHIEVETDGVKTSVPNPNYALFTTEFNAMLAEEIDVECPKVKLADLGNCETDVDLGPLLPFIDDEPEAKAA